MGARERLLDAEEELEEARSAYLRESGWEHVCDTPGSYWLWTRKLGDRLAMVDVDTAICIQRELDEQAIERMTFLVCGEPKNLPDTEEEIERLYDLFRPFDMAPTRQGWECRDAAGELVDLSASLASCAGRPMPLHFMPRPGVGA